jgi:hypothetical protein
MERKDWELRVYKQDRRCKAGERLVKPYTYPNWTQAEMAEEVRVLRLALYTSADGYRLEFEPYKTKVRSLMTGAEVEIRAKDKGTCLDPSQERYWSM